MLPAALTESALFWGLVGLLVLLAAVLVVVHWRLGRASRERDELRRRLTLTEAALADASDAFLVWAGDGELETSPALSSVLRLSPAPAPTVEAVIDAVQPADRKRLGEALRALRDSGEPFDLTLQLADGYRVAQFTGERLRVAQGIPPMDRVWVRDVSGFVETIAINTRERDRLSALLDALPLPVWIRSGRDLAIDYCNAAYARAVDQTSSAEVLERGLEIAGNAIVEGSTALARRARDLRAPQSETHHIVVGGNRRLFEFTEQPLDGHVLGYAVDVTALEEAQSELAHHIAAHAEVLGQLTTGIVIFGPDTRVKFFNNAYVQQFGLDDAFLDAEPTLAEVLDALRERRGLSEQVDFPAFKRERVRQLMGVIEPMEELLHLPNGSTLRMVAAPHPFGGVLVMYEDVTDKLALERSYNTLIEVQRETLDNLYEGIAVYGSDGRLKLSNPAFARIWGLAAEELHSEPHVSLIVDRVRAYFGGGPNWEELRDKLISGVSDRQMRTGRLERPDGTVLDFATVPLPDGGCLFTYLDVTDSIDVERALRERNAALETADRLKSEFIANVSYELRTPLNAIIGFAEILDHQYFGPLNERQVEYSRGIIEASQRLLSLINDILDIATIEAGYMQLELGPVDVGMLLAGVQTLTGERASNRGLSLQVDCPPNVGTILADERRLKQAIYNLVSNAIKFTPPGGRITVSARRDEREVQVTVADTGVGIAPEHQAIVFEKFARVGNGIQVRQGGAGLGLSLVKSLIELHGGTVELESAPDVGTRITCHVPVRRDIESLTTATTSGYLRRAH